MPNEIQIFSVTELKENDISINYSKVFTYPIHGHVYYEILVYEPFNGTITLNGARFNTQTPTAILITPNDFHSTAMVGKPPALCFKLQIKREIMEKFSRYAFPSTVTQNHERVAFLRALCEQAIKNQDDPDYLLKCFELIALTLQKSTGRLSFSGKSVTLIRNATDIIIQRFQEPLTLESVAAELHVSPQYLSNLFSRYADMSFIEYLTNRRMNYAITALQNGANVTEACFQSGYRNLSHFIRSFKKKYGITPAKFQREHKNATPHNGESLP